MSYGIGLIIESLVAALLLLTILYCARLNKQLGKLKADEALMKTTVAELLTAIERAERAIAGLRVTATEAEDTLGKRLRDAEYYCRTMTVSLTAGEDVLGRLRKIAYANTLLGGESTPEPDPVPAPPATDAKAVAAAAQAFTERARARAHGHAA